MKAIDLHCDTILLMMNKDKKIELFKNELAVDIEKLRKGDYLAQFFAMFVDLNGGENPLDNCLNMIDKFYNEIKKNEGSIALARNYNEMLKNNEEGKISAFLTIEEGGVLRGNISNLRNLYRLGVRLITITWNYENEIGYPNAIEECMSKGLKPFGVEVIDEMNRLGMLIDVSHLSDGGFYDVARLSKDPFVASHSNSRTVQHHVRNLKDDMIKIIADKGGIIGINFEKHFLGDNEISRVDSMIKHIKHLKNIGGIDVIALGSDYDGISPGVEIKDASEMGKLADGLRKNGFSMEEIEKIYYKNSMRVIKDVMK